PAGMSRLDRMQVSGGLALIHAKTSIKNGQTTYDGNPMVLPGRINQSSTNDGDMVPFSAIPFGYFVMPLDDQWHFGMGIYAPVGGKSDFESTFAGRSPARNTEVTMVTFQPTLSCYCIDMLSVGVGSTVNYLDRTVSIISLRPANPAARPAPTNPLGDVLYTAKGYDTAFGANVGVLFPPDENTTFGLAYLSH